MNEAESEPLKQIKLEIPNETKPRTFSEKLLYIKENITLEPVLACYVIPGTLARIATQDLNLDKACRVNKRYGDVVCDALIARKGNKYLHEEIAVQELIASMEIWKSILLTAIPSVMILFLGAWSDRTKKRKMCILLPIVGDFLMCLSNMLNTYYFYEFPVQVTMLMEAIFPAITGTWMITYMGVFSYICDITSEESRTFRMGILNLCLTAGGPIGSALSGILLKTTGYYGVFGISSLLFMLSLIYGYVYIKDPKLPETLENNTKNGCSGIRAAAKVFFDFNHVKDTFNVAFKSGPNHRRIKSIFIFIAIFFVFGPSYGEYIIRYLYTRYKFNWDILKYSFFTTFYICIHAVGALISFTLFSRRFKWDDSVLGLISSTSKIAGGMCTGLARTSLHMYLGVVVETFNASSYTVLRSISSKLVSNDELGKMTSLFNLMETLTYIVYGPFYSWLYMITVSIEAGFVYYISTALTMPAIGILIWFYIQYRKEVKCKVCCTETQRQLNDEFLVMSMEEKDNI